MREGGTSKAEGSELKGTVRGGKGGEGRGDELLHTRQPETRPLLRMSVDFNGN